MIQIGNVTDISDIINLYTPGSIERKTIDILSSSRVTYRYSSADELKFELDLRRSIVKAAVDLYKSRLRFKVFDDSECNRTYWTRTGSGGFILNENAKPSDAIKDIYINTHKYATECSTAIVIVYYKSLVDVFPESLFNNVFSSIHLMNWQHLDSAMGIRHIRSLPDYLPGDCRYFRNPDVDPLTPEWQGENTIDLGDGTFYGHGIGIKHAEDMIASLNRHRMEGSQTSAYLMDSATRPDFKRLANIYHS